MFADDFEQIVTEHYEPLYRFAFSLTRTEADASDLTQQTFYVWATKGKQLREFAKVKAWLFTTLHRVFLQARRRNVRFPHSSLDDVEPGDLPVATHSFSDLLDSSQVVRALSKVDPVYQAAVSLCYLEDCSYSEIAAILEIPEGTVKSRIARGIAQLRNLLGHVPPPRRLDSPIPDCASPGAAGS